MFKLSNMYNFAFNVKLSFRLINNANLFCLIIISNSYRYIHIGRTRDIRKRAFQIYFLLSNGQSLNMQILKNYRKLSIAGTSNEIVLSYFTYNDKRTHALVNLSL